MTDNQINFHSTNGKRQILIVEDEAINREILGAVLEDTYDILYAETGAEALELIRRNEETLSLVLLDLILPEIYGLDILRQMKEDPHISRIPVIVMTADRDAEVESLTLGAVDFIPKPYPGPKVIQARVFRVIELSEDRDIIEWTERDHLTGLYTREYFYHYASQMDVYHKERPMDTVVVDVNHFHMINERYGKRKGDELLKCIGGKLRETINQAGGIVCRLEADTFLVYCPHRTDYTELLNRLALELADMGKVGSRVRLRMGVYAEADKTIDVERRFDRAKMAADTIRNSFTKAIAVYDDALHEEEIFSEQMVEDFRAGIDQKQFVVYYQPKFDIRADKPILSSAEALVRWQHPELGLLTPGAFMPLFESNGLIQELDNYVWRSVAAQMRDWKDRLGISVPVSVNVSRVDMYDPGLVEDIRSIVDEAGLNSRDFLLEITESAYTQETEKIIEVVNHLRDEGFRIEMDDFGTGYSSLSMISKMPIDALKLDMQFIRDAFKDRKDTRMLEIIIEIADSLRVPTIAEGVETAEQMITLKAMGCGIVQGYFFSKPIPAADYEKFLLERKQIDEERRQAAPSTAEFRPKKRRKAEHDGTSKKKDYREFTYDALHDPLTGLYNYSAYELLRRDADHGHIAILVVSVDDFQEIGKTYGREMEDRIILWVAEVLRRSFRSVDTLCRIGRDEFVVIMTRMNGSMRGLVLHKVAQANERLQNPENGLLPVSLSVGIAFSDRQNPEGDIFKDADSVLYRMKKENRRGCEIY